MKMFSIQPASLLGVCLLAVLTGAEAQIAGGNPYRPVTAHNAFGLKPAAVTAQPAPTPPAAITLNGITTIFGDKRALFKVQPPRPAREQVYFMSEGERDGDMELLSVDVQAGRIKVSDHGTIRIIALCPTPRLEYPGNAASFAGGTGGIYPGSPGGAPGGQSVPGAGIPGTAAGQFYPPGFAGGAGNTGTPGNNDGAGSDRPGANDAGAQNSPAADTGSANAGGPSSEPYALRAARDFEQTRLQTADAVRSGAADPLPLTPLTPPGTPAELIGPGRAWFAED